MRYVWCLVWVASIGFLQTPIAAGADKPAEALIKEGLNLRRAGRDIEALERMQRAYDLDPSPRSAAQVGLCLQAVGRWSDADVKLSEALSSPNDPWISKNRDVLRESIEAVKQHVGRVEIIGSPDGAQIFVAGKLVGRLPLSMPVPVDEGTVDVEGRADGFGPLSRTVVVKGGQYQKLVLRLEASVAPSSLAVATPPESINAQSSDLSAAATSPAPSSDARPIYKRGWFWGAVGGVVVVGVLTAVLLSSGQSTTTGPIMVDRMETF